MLGFVVCIPPLILQQLGRSAGEVALLLTLLSALQVLAHLHVLPQLARHVGREQSLVGLAALAAAATAILAFWQRDAGALFGLLPLAYLGACLSAGLSNMTSAIYAQHLAEGVVGAVAGISRAFFALGFGVAPSVSVMLFALDYSAPFLAVSCIFVVAGSLQVAVVARCLIQPVVAAQEGAVVSVSV